MDDAKSHLPVYLAATIGLVGVIAGAGITGFVQTRAAKLAYDKDMAAQKALASRELGQTFINAASDFFTQLCTYAYLLPGDLSHPEAASQRRAALQASAFRLSLLTSPSTAQKVLGAAVAAASLAETMPPEKMGPAKQAIVKKIVDAYVALYRESSNYRWRSSPEADSELRDTVIQLLESSPAPKR
jgi:hypothetical protein